MYEVVWIARYRKGLTKQEGSDYWATLHGPPMREVSPVAGYVQSHVQGPLPAVSGEAEIGFAGFSECWLRDERQFLDAVESDTSAAAVEDARNVFDMTQMWGAALRENVVIAPQLVGT